MVVETNTFPVNNQPFLENQQVKKESFLETEQRPLSTGYQAPLYTGTPQQSNLNTTTGSSGGTLHKIGDKLKNAFSGSSTTTNPTLNQGYSQGYQQQTFSSGLASSPHRVSRTDVIQERPVLDKVEKIVHREIVEKPRIIEDHERELIEVHEQPVQKKILHPAQEMHIRETDRFEVMGKETADLERQRFLEEMRLKDRAHQVSVQERQDVHVVQEAPTYLRGDELRKEIIQKPIVTEIHEQPIIEVHEQDIHKTVYEKPVVTVVREQPIIESTTSVSQPLSGLTQSFHRMEITPQPVIAPPPKPVIKEVIKEVPVMQPVTVSTTVVEKEKGLPPRVREDLNQGYRV